MENPEVDFHGLLDGEWGEGKVIRLGNKLEYVKSWAYAGSDIGNVGNIFVTSANPMIASSSIN